jgi:hypothetical protein
MKPLSTRTSALFAGCAGAAHSQNIGKDTLKEKTMHTKRTLLSLFALFALAVTAARPAQAVNVQSVITPSSVIAGGRQVVGQVVLDGPAPAGGVIVLLGCQNENGTPSTLANPHLFNAPNIHQVFINAGYTGAAFQIDTVGVAATVQPWIAARVGNGVIARAPLTLRRAQLASLWFSKDPVGMYSNCLAVAQLDGAAPVNGSITITFTSTNPNVAVPVSGRVVISGDSSNNDSAVVRINTGFVLWDTHVFIVATENSGNSVHQDLLVKPFVF